jgi:hypothetical protein
LKKLVTLLVLLLTTIGFSQTLSTPTSQDIPVGVNGVGISGFSLSGYNANTTYKVSLSITGNANASFTIGTTTGLTRDYGYNSWTNISSVNFTGIPANIENALNSIKFNTTSTLDGLINLSVVITSQVTGMYYNPTNGHMYKSVASSIDYATAKSLASQSTFDGVQGYLVTITSQDEQNFIVQKTSQNNIWIALEDTAVEGYWRISAGPENETLIKTSNGQTNGNISGQYNNWCSGEPNNAGNEDAAVTKWGGGGCWNDLPASGYNGGGYVIEYGDWTDPTQSTFNSTQQTQITFTQKEMLWVDYEFDFGSNINPTDFSGKMHYEESANSWVTNNTTDLTLNSLGKVNTTSQIQETSIGKKATTVGGNVEWCVIYAYDNTNKRYRVGIDKREFPSGFDFTNLKKLQLFDLWNGDITYKSNDAYWAEYYIYTETPLDFTNSNYSSYIRSMSYGNHALRAEFSFEDNLGYKPQSFIFNSPTQTEIETLISDVITVSDVVLAFNELTGGGLNGGTAGNLNGLQLGNADVNGDNNFDFNDTYKLLDYLNGGSLVQATNTLVYFMKIKSKADWDTTTTSNWTSKYNGTTLMADVDVDENNLIQFPNYKVTWLGDVNMSHSPTSVNATAKSARTISYAKENEVTAYIETELIDNKVVAIVEIKSNNLAGIQLRLNYSNLLGEHSTIFSSLSTNFISAKNGYLSFGTLSTEQSTLEQTIKYTIEFETKTELNSTLGLITVQGVDAIDTNNNPVTIRII